MGKYLLNQNKEFDAASKSLDAIIKKEKELKEQASQLDVGQLEKAYKTLWMRQFTESVKTSDIEAAKEDLKSTKEQYDTLCADLESIASLKPSAVARMESTRDQAEHELYLLSKKDFSPIFAKIIAGLKELNALHSQVKSIINDLEAAGVSYRTLFSIQMIYLRTSRFDPGSEKPVLNSSQLFELIKFGKEQGLLD